MRKRNKNSIVLLICGPRRQVELKDPRWLEVVFHSLPSVFSWPPISIPSHSGQEPSQCAKLRGGPSQAVPQAQCDKETGSLLSMSSVCFLERFTTSNEEKHSWSDSRWPVHCSHQEWTWLPLRREVGWVLGTTSGCQHLLHVDDLTPWKVTIAVGIIPILQKKGQGCQGLSQACGTSQAWSSLWRILLLGCP